MRRGRTRIGAWLGAAVVAALLAWLLWPSSEEREYVTAPVERGPIVATVGATGAVNPVRSVQVGTYVSGPILELYADFNSPVVRGQRIAKIDPRTFVGKVEINRAELANAEARVAKASADLELKRTQLGRQRALARTAVTSANELDIAAASAAQAEAELQLARAGVEQARAALREAEVNLGYTDILSPIDGIVVSRNVDVGQTVAASFQTPTLFVIAEDLARMEVYAFVSEADVGRVHEGQSASFTVDAFPGRPFAATVRQVRNAPTTLQNVVTYDVVLEVDNSAGLLKPGMTANVRIVTDERVDVLLVPSAALRFRPPETGEDAGVAPAARAAASHAGTTRDMAPASPASDAGAPAPLAAARAAAGGTRPGRVYRLEGDRLVPVEVAVGISDDTLTQVEGSGLAAGDRVVLRIRSAAPPPSGALPGMGRPGR